jgi:S1-C subfamily serine protease
MGRVFHTLGLAFMTAFWAFSAQAAGPFGTIHVGKWSGGAYTDDKTGAFSHCAVTAPYNSGINLFLTETVNGIWVLGFAHQNWDLAAGQTSTIDLTFDGQAQFHVFASAVNKVLITAILPTGPVRDHLRKDNTMVAVINGQAHQFVLTSAGEAMSAVTNCVTKTKASGVAHAGDFSHPEKPAVKQAKSAAPPPPAQPSKTKTVEVSGSGFVVSPTGHIVTNQHVIGGCVGDIRGNAPGGSPMNLRVVSTDEINDLALLQAPITFTDTAKIRGTAIRSGEAVIAIGFPFHGLLTSDVTVTTGIISSLSGILNDTRHLQISAPVQPGNSGGPLLDMSGNVVGVVAAKLNAIKFAKVSGDLPENVNFAIKTGAMRDFLDNSVIPYTIADAGAELKTAEIAEKARNYVILVSCTAKEKE